MSRFVFSSLRLIVTSVLVFSPLVLANAQSNNTDESTFIKLQHDWAAARKNIDLAFLENFYAKEFTVGNMDGIESSRAKDLSMFLPVT